MPNPVLPLRCFNLFTDFVYVFLHHTWKKLHQNWKSLYRRSMSCEVSLSSLKPSKQTCLIMCLLHLCAFVVSEPTQWLQQRERRGSSKVSSFPRQRERAVWALPRHVRFWPCAHGGWKISEGQSKDTHSETVSIYYIIILDFYYIIKWTNAIL